MRHLSRKLNLIQGAARIHVYMKTELAKSIAE